jgi:aldehyde dehydrogenase (NAD+)
VITFLHLWLVREWHLLLGRILEFTYARTVVRARFQLPISFTSFKRTKGNDKLIVAATRLLNGRLG